MNNDLKDKQFIALELTKIAQPPTKDEIYKAYEYFLKQIMEITDNIDTINSLKNEINKLQKENERLKSNNQDILGPFCEELMFGLNSAKGDMEPYVYSSLVNIIKAKMQ